MRKLLGIGAFIAVIGTAHADSANPINIFSINAKPALPVAAVMTTFAAEPGKAVRLAIYDSAEAFLESAHSKLEAPLSDAGVALLPLDKLKPGEYAFAAYLDENGDGKLNRGSILGRPKEPVAFSNGAKAKLSKPSFEEAKVKVEAGSVVVITLDD